MSIGQRCPELYISASVSHRMWVVHRGAWAFLQLLLHTLVYLEGAETTGCLLTALLTHSAISPSLKENLVGA